MFSINDIHYIFLLLDDFRLVQVYAVCVEKRFNLAWTIEQKRNNQGENNTGKTKWEGYEMLPSDSRKLVSQLRA